MSEYKKNIQDLIAVVLKEDASDLHLSEGRQPIILVSGILVPLLKQPVMSKVDIKGILDELLIAKKKEEFLKEKDEV